MNRPTAPEKFWSRVNKSGSCWTWEGARQSRGYGVFFVDGKHTLAHRYSIQLAGVAIPAGHLVDHLCHNRLCVHPRHLRVVTNKQNIEHRKAANSNSKTGLRGVWFEKRTGLYVAEVTHSGHKHYAGSHSTPELAAEAARQLRLSLFTHSNLDRQEIPA